MSSVSALSCRPRKKKDSGLFSQQPDMVCVICLSVYCMSVVHDFVSIHIVDIQMCTHSQ